MRTVARLLLLAVFFPWLALWVWRMAVGINNPLAPPSDPIHSAQGYMATVDLFLRHDWLEFDPIREEIVPKFEKGSPMERFYRSSYLERDVEAFNSGNRSVFRVDNGRILSIDPNRHNIVLPFSKVRSWPGLLTYRPESGHSGELRGDGVVIALFGPTREIRGQERLPEIILPPQGLSGRQRPEAQERRQRGEAVLLLDSNGATLGKAHLIGGSILFNNRGYGSGMSISISGEQVPAGNRSRMDSGDLLKLRWRLGTQGRSQYALLWSSILGEAPVISAYRAINGHWRRTPEKPEPQFAGNVAEALNGAFQRRMKDGRRYVIPENRQAEEFDLALTLDSELQEEVQRHLRDYANGLRRRDATPFRAAVTVMDTRTGELLALASYPTSDDLGDWEEGTAARERLLRNHNFSRLPIGSVAKVFLASAILQEAPSLASLHIRGYPGGEIDQILGIELDPVMDDHPIADGGDGWLDFDEFIEKSSNKYAATLLTLATATDGDRLRPPLGDPDIPDTLPFQEQFEYGGALWTQRPSLRLPIVRNTRPPDPKKGPRAPAFCRRISTLEFAPYAENLNRLFGLEISRKTIHSAPDRQPRRAPGKGDDMVDTSPWLPVLEHLYGDRESIPSDHPFYGASPERENLAYNLMDSYRQQYLSVVLGGGSSTWTMPRVCEIFSRLVTGRQVDTNLVRRIRLWDGEVIEADPAQLPPPMPMSPAVRQRVANALTLVAGPQGTAKALRATLLNIDHSFQAKGKALGFFSKTGSPNNTTFVPTRTARAVDALIRSGALRLDNRGRITYRGSGPVRAERTEDSNSAVPSLNALQANPEDMAILRRYGVKPRHVINVCSTWNTSRPEDRTQFEVRQGKLVRLISTSEIKSIGGAYAFTMGLYDGVARTGTPEGYLPRIDVLNHQPERALTASIIIETRGNGPTIAVPFAKILIEEVLKNALANGW
jgi:hypothetical protein